MSMTLARGAVPLLAAVFIPALATAQATPRDQAVAALRDHVNDKAGFELNLDGFRTRDLFEITGVNGCVLEVTASSRSDGMDQDNHLSLDLATVAPGSRATKAERYDFWTVRLDKAGGAPDWTFRRATRMRGQAEDRREVSAGFTEIGFGNGADAETGRDLLERAVGLCAPAGSTAPPPSAAPAPAGPAGAPVVTGFSGHNWGATAQSIRSREGTPVETLDEPGGLRTYVYRETVLNEEVDVMFGVHPQKGLYSGGYVVELETGADCEAVIRKFENAISERYPSLTPRRDRRNDSSLGFCDGLIIGRASSRTVWMDAANSTMISVGTSRSGRDIMVFYAGPEFREINEQSQAAERNRRF